MAELLFNYVHEPGEPSNETIEFIEKYKSVPTVDFSIEQQFVHAHTLYVRSQCLHEFYKLDKQEDLKIERTVNVIFQCWRDIAYTDRMNALFSPKPYILEACQMTFAAIVRACIDTNWLVQTAGATAIDTELQSKFKQCGLDLETNRILAQQIPSAIEQYVTANYAETYKENCLNSLLFWVESEFVPLLAPCLPKTSHDFELTIEKMRSLASQCLCKLRINELFKIINSENELGLCDLKECMKTPELRTLAIDTFLTECDRNVLSGAADTVEIIQFYLKTVKSFSLLDPQGILLERAAQHIRPKLKERNDTPNEIAAGLFGVQSQLNYLYDLLLQKTPKRRADAIRKGFQAWVPDPLDTPVDFVRKQNQDTIYTLLDLFDNKDVFVKQFAILFKNEFLPLQRNSDNALTSETDEAKVKRLEVFFDALTSRFGEMDMANIRVMLDDAKQSIYLGAEMYVLSRHFWPQLSSVEAFKVDDLPWPEHARKPLRKLEKTYQQLNKYSEIGIEWIPSYCYTSLTLELKDRKLDLTVTAEQAAVIALFDDVSELSFDELLEKSGLPSNLLTKCLDFWTSINVIANKNAVYIVLETLDMAETNEQKEFINAKENEGIREIMEVYWSFIVGMLTNLGSLPVEKIHSFLAFVPSDSPFVQTKQELENYLLSMVDEGKLTYDKTASTFSLP